MHGSDPHRSFDVRTFPKPSEMLTGTILITALNRTKRMVRVVALDGSYREMSAIQAIAVVRDSDEYVGRGTKRKCSLVERIGRVERRPDPVWESCWRNSESAVLYPSADYWRNVA